ncbi:sensor histidine kinase [Oryzifoliimicrobium ureilyticus]|uniref:sensor histidine kinase n=1 Tax=Oryzifoliimicrobium ureilyticus TaxID=3113724 RepID=UPI0030762384
MTEETDHLNLNVQADPQFDRQLLAAIVDSSFDAIVSKDLNGIVLTWNQAAERLYGFTAEEMIGKSILAVVPAHLHDEEMQILKRIEQGERIIPFETVRQHKNGSYVPVSLTMSPIRNSRNEIIGASKIARDISMAKDRERRIRLLLREVNHRVKNQYAIILSMIKQSRATMRDPENFESQIRQRIMALSASHDLLVSGDWSGAGLAELIRAHLKTFHRENLIYVSGPLVKLTPNAVENLGMAFHELAVNSSKHGVLHQERGGIYITWDLDGVDGEPRIFTLSWEEVFADDIAVADMHGGFGSVILKRIAPQALNSTVEWNREANRLVWKLKGPAENFVSRRLATD